MLCLYYNNLTSSVPRYLGAFICSLHFLSFSSMWAVKLPGICGHLRPNCSSMNKALLVPYLIIVSLTA